MNPKMTLISASRPSCVTKEFSLVDDVLKKTTTANVFQGRIEVNEVAGANDFAELLQSLGPNQCLTYGIPPHDARLITKEEWLRLGQPHDAFPRSKSVFAWPDGPGILMLDYDPPKDGVAPYKPKELVGLLSKLLPTSATLSMVWWPSTSSHIFSGDKDLTGIRGQRIYLFVEDATDIERAGNALNERLWALGYGRYEVSSSGSLLKRSVFDGSVWQPNHIDFAAGAKCGHGLSQRRGKPRVIVSKSMGFLDTRKFIPDLTESERIEAIRNQELRKTEQEVKARSIREKWIHDRKGEFAKRDGGSDSIRVESTILRAIDRRILDAEWAIRIRDRDGTEKNITIANALDNPERFHGLLTQDPLEPEYDGGRFVGKLFLKGHKPNLHSFAHGGANYRLCREQTRIELVAGKSKTATDELLTVLRNSPDIYDFGAEIVQVGDQGNLVPLTEGSLKYVVGGLVQFWTKRNSDGRQVEALRDPPGSICRTVIDLKELRRLKSLVGVVTAPTIKLGGELLLQPGYDQDTKLLYAPIEEPPFVPIRPTQDQAREALRIVWQPFVEFPFCSGLDRAVHLSALLTAAIRSILPAAPGFAYDAPVQGSGKTLLARCLGVLAQGTDPGVWPHTSGRDDEEIRKRVFSVLRSGAKVLIWDNVVGAFDSAAMASLMTSPSFTDRILGQSASSTVPNKILLALTGNNILLKGEMPRRILISRIDPATDKPFAREFDLDPYSYCKSHRHSLIASALTLIRAQLTHGFESKVSGKLASFEDWDALIRRTVVYCNELSSGEFGDVMDAVRANQSSDPEQEALSDLLRLIEDLVGDRPFTVTELLDFLSVFPLVNPSSKGLKDIFDMSCGAKRGDLNARSVGRYLGYRKDRIADGRLLEHGLKMNDKQTWRIRRVDSV